MVEKKKSKATGKAKAPANPLRPARLTTRRALENQDIAAVEKSLTERQRRFCHEYAVDFDKKGAVMRAGYDTRWPVRQADLLLQNEGVKAVVAHLTKEKSFEITAVSPDYVITRVTAIVSDPDSKNSDKLRGLELLARHLGMLTDKQEITGKDGGPLSVAREEIKQEAESLVNLLTGLAEQSESDDTTNVVKFEKKAG